jgi:hypothetical protein
MSVRCCQGNLPIFACDQIPLVVARSQPCVCHHRFFTPHYLSSILAMFLLFARLLLIPLAVARDIVFPQSSSFDQQPIFEQNGIDINGDIDISTGSAFAGLTTYANLPYVHCLAAKDEEVGKYDIAILGAPFDTVSSLLSQFLDVWNTVSR